MLPRNYDVIVCGGGIAGVAAALESARSGKRTALLEKTIFTGGLATSGIVRYYLALCNGQGTQVIFGISEELLRLSIKYGPGDIPGNWRQSRNGEARFQTGFSPASFVLALDEALKEADVSLWLDTLVCMPIMDNDRITGVEVETKSGREKLTASCVIDATGDADIAFRAGAPCEAIRNTLSMWTLYTSLNAARESAKQESGIPLLQTYEFGGDFDDPEHSPKGLDWAGTDSDDVTSFVLHGRRIYLDRLLRQQAETGEEGRKNVYPMTLPSQAQFRRTRRIIGNYNLTTGQNNIHMPDSIGLAPDWRKPGPVWEIPYGTLVPVRIKGLLAAGRCMAAGEDAWDVMRVIPVAAVTGQAAGTAAALAIDDGVTPDMIDTARLQQRLRAKGIPCHLNEVGL